MRTSRASALGDDSLIKWENSVQIGAGKRKLHKDSRGKREEKRTSRAVRVCRGLTPVAPAAFWGGGKKGTKIAGGTRNRMNDVGEKRGNRGNVRQQKKG